MLSFILAISWWSFWAELGALIGAPGRIRSWLGYRARRLGQCLLHPVGHGKSVHPEEREVQQENRVVRADERKEPLRCTSDSLVVFNSSSSAVSGV